MKRLVDYIFEKDDKKKDDNKLTKNFDRKDIKFTIWASPDRKVTKLKDNSSYQKIEFQLEDYDENLSIDFLLGFQDSMWKLWIGKIGSCSYDDDPYCKLNTDSFDDAINKAIDKTYEFVKKVKDDPRNYVQYYKDL